MRTIYTSTEVSQLPETGEAWLVAEDGTARAKFYDGRIIRAAGRYPGDDNETEKAA